MKIFKKTEEDYNTSKLVQLIQSYHDSKKEIIKTNTEYSTYWWTGVSLMVAITFFPLFFFPSLILPMYGAAIYYRIKYNKWVKKINKVNNDIAQEFHCFLQNNEKEILKSMHADIKTKELDEIFNDIVGKCASDEYNEGLIFQIDNFFFRLQEYKRNELKEEKTKVLKKMYQISDKTKDSKEKYTEMC